MQNEIITESMAPLPRHQVVDVGFVMPLLEGDLVSHSWLFINVLSLVSSRLPGAGSAGRCILILIQNEDILIDPTEARC